MKFNIFKRKIKEEVNIEKIDKSTRANGFGNTIDFANDIIKYEEEEDKIKLLDYILNTVKKDLKYSLLTEIMYKEEHKAINLSRLVIFPERVYGENEELINTYKDSEKKINILEDDIIVVPWNRRRKVNSIKKLNKYMFQFQETNHMGIYYEDIDLVYIHDGIHSISGAIEINKKGEIYIRKVKDIRKLYNHLYTDGIYWYSTHTNEKIDEVFDFRIAIIYEISKLKNKIKKGE